MIPAYLCPRTHTQKGIHVADMACGVQHGGVVYSVRLGRRSLAKAQGMCCSTLVLLSRLWTVVASVSRALVGVPCVP
jgi:hypothetical protein